MSSKYKYTGPITSNHQQRDFKRWVIVYADGKENCINRKSYAIMAAKYHLENGDDVHLYEETVIRNYFDGHFSEDTFRIEMTDRIKYEILAEKYNREEENRL